MEIDFVFVKVNIPLYFNCDLCKKATRSLLFIEWMQGQRFVIYDLCSFLAEGNRIHFFILYGVSRL